LSDGEELPPLPHVDADLDRFLRSLSSAWKQGEVRPTHRGIADRQPRARHWRTREDPFEEVWDELLEWLGDEPDRTAQELLGRLQTAHPGLFPDGQLRTLQRRVKTWRRTKAQELVFGATPSVDSLES
jgi:hypothetical protein